MDEGFCHMDEGLRSLFKDGFLGEAGEFFFPMIWREQSWIRAKDGPDFCWWVGEFIYCIFHWRCLFCFSNPWLNDQTKCEKSHVSLISLPILAWFRIMISMFLKNYLASKKTIVDHSITNFERWESVAPTRAAKWEASHLVMLGLEGCWSLVLLLLPLDTIAIVSWFLEKLHCICFIFLSLGGGCHC